jgi:hypothetical protein
MAREATTIVARVEAGATILGAGAGLTTEVVADSIDARIGVAQTGVMIGVAQIGEMIGVADSTGVMIGVAQTGVTTEVALTGVTIGVVADSTGVTKGVDSTGVMIVEVAGERVAAKGVVGQENSQCRSSLLARVTMEL